MGAPHRFYLPPAEWSSPDVLRLGGDEAHHCTKVFRHQPGDVIELFDGRGLAVRGRILMVSAKQVTVEVTERDPVRVLPFKLALAQAVPKGKTMDWVVQKATEIGVAEIYPMETRRAVVKLHEAKGEKWQRTALESCKQCGRNELPVVHDGRTLEAFVKEDGAELKLVAALCDRSLRLREILASAPAPKSVSLLVGPEGDFTPEELAELLERGYQPMSLGPTVLRSETAAIYALSVISYELLPGLATFGGPSE